MELKKTSLLFRNMELDAKQINGTFKHRKMKERKNKKNSNMC